MFTTSVYVLDDDSPVISLNPIVLCDFLVNFYKHSKCVFGQAYNKWKDLNKRHLLNFLQSPHASVQWSLTVLADWFTSSINNFIEQQQCLKHSLTSKSNQSTLTVVLLQCIKQTRDDIMTSRWLPATKYHTHSALKYEDISKTRGGGR
jgi:hypothetical protein